MRSEIRHYLLAALLCGCLLALYLYCAPPEPASLTAYAGLTLLAAGVVSLLKPLRFIGIRTRRAGLWVAGAGGILLVAALSWTPAVKRIAHSDSRLDEVMPEYHFSERHEVKVQAPPAAVSEALKQVTLDDLQVYDMLMRVRAMASGQFSYKRVRGELRILDLLNRPGSGFVPLLQTDREIVMGMAGQPWGKGRRPDIKDAAAYRDFHDPASVKIAFNLRIVDEGSGRSRVITETRILATDDAGLRTMGRYWRLVYPGSAMIRKMWMNAVRLRAEHPQPAA